MTETRQFSQILEGIIKRGEGWQESEKERLLEERRD
jgi:hypothetical protein